VYTWSKSGSGFTVHYLKECFRLTCKSVAGEATGPSGPARVASRRGLPLIIPGPLRLLIEKRDPRVIKVVLSLLSLYRVMFAFPKRKLETITQPFSGLVDTLPSYEVERVYKESFKGNLEVMLPAETRFSFMRREPKSAITPSGNLLPLYTAGPNGKPSILQAYLDAIAFQNSPEMMGYLRTVIKYTGLKLGRLLDEELATTNVAVPGSTSLKLGRLAEKLEAAGKVRIFAITDI